MDVELGTKYATFALTRCLLNLLVPVLKAAKRSHISGSIEALIGLCAHRRRMGSPLRRFSIVRSQRVSRADVAQLRHVVGRVIWDELELNGGYPMLCQN